MSRPLGDVLRARDWVVRAVDLPTAEALVVRLHYARGASNTATYLHGLFKRGEDFWDNSCLGTAWWIPPTLTAAEATFPENPHGVLALSRLAIDPSVPTNGCSFLIARSRRLIDRCAWPCLLSYADEGQGHTGAIYLADNWTYLGLTKPEPSYVLNGRQISRKAGPKTRTHAEMEALGAQKIGSFRKHKFVHIVERAA